MTDEYWKSKSLAEMNAAEWEGLCDGCALCCMHKLQDDETGEIFYSDVACRLLDIKTCRCTNYANRVREVADCLQLSADDTAAFAWLPKSCAYRRLANGQELPSWHPLITGDPESVHAAGISMRGRATPEAGAQDYSVLWPLNDET